ncbi:ABC transporter substrate-binding protein [Anaerosporobacter faecicola]|uniref:ABC transporter substrate-binding protein n=1 Tax=Anaerosporobacter faecicola TaxID=2718714 RepID=UPI00143A9341|nr:extracellular solute-binding protein [Anaerosporobacter faecicola]
MRNRNTKKRRRSMLLLLMVLLLLFVTGCASKKAEQKNKGRYVEKEVSLPEFEEGENILQISTNKEGNLRIYSIKYKDSHMKADIYQYDWSKEELFTKSKTEWLQDLPIGEVNSEQNKYIYDGGDVQYAYFNCYSNDVWKNLLYCTKDEKMGEQLPVKSWEKENQESVNMGATQSGKLYEQTSTDLLVYEEDKKDFVSVLDIQDYSNGAMCTGGNKIILYSKNQNGEIAQYNVWNEEELQKEPQTFNVDPTFDVFGFVNKKNDIAMVDNTGIHQIVEGTSAAQTVVDGSMNMMYAISSYPKEIVMDDAENYFVLYYLIDRDEYQIMEYTYDPEVASVPEKTLTVYSLNYDLWTREAATIFQREHPDVRVELHVSLDENATATPKDYIRQLNTELLNNEGPDVMVMDGLPLESYMEKGTLLDIRDVINPLLDQGELLENVAAFYKQEDGSYYTMPANIELPMMLSCKEGVEASSSLDGIAAYVKQAKDPSKVMGKQSWEKLMNYFLPVYLPELIKGDEINTAQIADFLEKLQVIYDGGGYSEEDKQTKEEEFYDDYMGALEMIDGLQMKYIQGRGFYNICLPEGVSRVLEGKVSVIDQTFYPISSLSINKNSKNVELAKEFIQCVLSQKIQESEFQTGFSVNPKALEARKGDKKKQEQLKWTYDLPDKDGNTVKIPYGWLEDDRLDKYIQLCNTVTKSGDKNPYLIATFVENSTDFAEGKESAEQAAEKIVEKLKIYLKE